MTTRFGINGFGRMGRLALRAAWKRSDVEFVHVNDPTSNPTTSAHVLTFVTAASCTTDCFAPVAKVIHEAIGIRHGSITTLHDMTNTRTIVDARLTIVINDTRVKILAWYDNERGYANRLVELARNVAAQLAAT